MEEVTIRAVINTLNQIEVRGKDNIDRLLGCILALESMEVKSGQSTKTGGETDAGQSY